jgi:hypothetical protein
MTVAVDPLIVINGALDGRWAMNLVDWASPE